MRAPPASLSIDLRQPRALTVFLYVLAAVSAAIVAWLGVALGAAWLALLPLVVAAIVRERALARRQGHVCLAPASTGAPSPAGFAGPGFARVDLPIEGTMARAGATPGSAGELNYRRLRIALRHGA